MAALLLLLISCDNESWLYTDPNDVLTDEQVWTNEDLVLAALADLYDRIPSFNGIFDTSGDCEWDDAMFCGSSDGDYSTSGTNGLVYGGDYGRYYDYDLIYDINYDLENLESYASNFDDEDVALWEGEIRFIRAYVYFELVKRMGGVPLVTSTTTYTGGTDIAYMEVARSSEGAIYNFIYDECEAIKDNLDENDGSRSRVNKYTVLALESRAMLYAASIANYTNTGKTYNGSTRTTLSYDAYDVIGISSDSAEYYYKLSLAASQEIINSGAYELVSNLGDDAGENYYQMLQDKDNDGEIIWAKDYIEDLVKTHDFTYLNIPIAFTEDTECSSEIGPSFSLVNSYQTIYGEDMNIPYKDADGNYILYGDMADIFEDYDPRLTGSVILPGSTWNDEDVDIQAGVALTDDGENFTFSAATSLNTKYTDGELQTGSNGPLDNSSYVTQTGFYLRKFVSNESGASSRSVYATNWWPYFRMGEIYLNAAEAAWELDDDANALTYINAVRERAGFDMDNGGTLTSLSLEDFVRERRCELAFEDQRFFDLKRWRIADLVWDGSATTASDNDAVDEDNACMISGLYPYRVVSDNADYNGKYIFRKWAPTRFHEARHFYVKNYYASFSDDAMNHNSKLVQNPYH